MLFVTCTAGVLALAFGTLGSAARQSAGGVIGTFTAGVLSHYFNRTGAAIVLLAVIALAIIVSTQLSLGTAALAVGKRVRVQRGLVARWREWRDARARAHERQQVVDKHVKAAGKDRAPEIATKAASAAETLRAARTRAVADDEDEEIAPGGPSRGARDQTPAPRAGPAAAAARRRGRRPESRPNGARAATRRRPSRCSTLPRTSTRLTNAN